LYFHPVFIAGTLYGRLRTFIREHGEVLLLGSVTTRKDVFFDVAQDVSILLVRAGAAHRLERVVSFGHVGAFGPFKSSAAHALPQSSDRPWIAQAKQSRKIGGLLNSDPTTLRSSTLMEHRRPSSRRRLHEA
jgi:adenine-specific DNA-methyltransferase